MLNVNTSIIKDKEAAAVFSGIAILVVVFIILMLLIKFYPESEKPPSESGFQIGAVYLKYAL